MYHQLGDGDDDGLTDMVRALLPPTTTTSQKGKPTHHHHHHSRHAQHTTTMASSSPAPPNDDDDSCDDEYYTPPTSRTREVSPSTIHTSSPLRHNTTTPITTTSPTAISNDAPSPLPHRTVVPSRTFISGGLNTISNRYCAGVSPSVVAGQSPPPPKLQGTTYTDRRQELYALMGYASAVPTATATAATDVLFSPTRGSSEAVHQPLSFVTTDHSPSIRRPIPTTDIEGGTTPPALLQYHHTPHGSRRRDTSSRLPSEMPLKAPSVSPSPLSLLGRQHSLSLPRHTTTTSYRPPTLHTPPPPLRLLGTGSGDGGGSTRCRGTKAGPSAEVAAARSLFALLVAEEERVGAALRSEAREAAAASLNR